MKIAKLLLLLLTVTTFSCDSNDYIAGTNPTVAQLCNQECADNTNPIVDENLRQCYCTYAKDVKHGKFIQWYENGQKKLEREYWEGAIVGVNRTWYENSAPKGEFVWLVDDNFYIVFREMFNGHLILEGCYKDGLQLGEWVFYDLADGRKTMDANFIDGVHCGEVRCYDNNGQLAVCAADILDQLINDGCEITATGANCPVCPPFYE